MCQRSTYCVLSVISILLSVVCIVSLVLAVQHVYLDEFEHHKHHNCNITSCSVVTSSCGGNSECYDITYTIMLILDGQSYNKTLQSFQNSDTSICNQKIITCYYDDRIILESLGIDRTTVAQWMIYTVAACALLVVIFIILSVIFIAKSVCL